VNIALLLIVLGLLIALLVNWQVGVILLIIGVVLLVLPAFAGR
jgi:hypothetical protein